MSVLAQKHVLIVGDETNQVHDIASTLKREGAVVETKVCSQVSASTVEKDKIDVIFLNHLHDDSHCSDFLLEVQQYRGTKVIPTFVLVNDRKAEIEKVLSYGAADYFTQKETVDSILNKVRIVMGESVNAAGNIVIDIGEAELPTSKTGIKVLVVEDDALLANLLSIRLEKSSFPYHINADGKNITKDLDEFNPDVVVLDLMLPGCSGFEVLEQIRNHENSKDVPVFIFSNRDSAEDKSKASSLGVSGFYVKAMTDLSELIKNITKAVENSKSK